MSIAQKGEGSASKGRIVLATVKGDVHDIGKNIVKVILENYGFEVIDLGRDVPVETVVNTVREKMCIWWALSALMTTTLKSMEETIAALHQAGLGLQDHGGRCRCSRRNMPRKIGADWYAKDAQTQRRHRQGIFRGRSKRAKERCAGSISPQTRIGPIPSPALLPFGQQGPTPADGLRRYIPAHHPDKQGPPLKTPENLFANCSQKLQQRNAHDCLVV